MTKRILHRGVIALPSQTVLPPTTLIPSGPITISAGGTYDGYAFTATGAQTVIQINTTQPVVIQNCTITNLGTGALIECTWGMAVQVTVQNCKGFGGEGRFFECEGHKSMVIEHCTLDKTGGIKCNVAGLLSTTRVRYNKAANAQNGQNNTYMHQFCQLTQINGRIDTVANYPGRFVRDCQTPEIAWNEVINQYGIYSGEDCISTFYCGWVWIHDNYIDGNYPIDSVSSSSGGGISCDWNRDTMIEDNVTLSCINGGIGIVHGFNNTIRNNKILSDGRYNGGALFGAIGPGGNVGMIKWDGSPNSSPDSNYANNHVTGNTVGHVSSWNNTRNDMWFMPDTAEYSANTSIPGGVAAITDALEKAEWNTWVAKKAAAGVTCGANF